MFRPFLALGVLVAAGFVFTPPTAAAQEDSADKLIAGAVEALPVYFREGAEVRAWREEGLGLRVLRRGGNSFICLADREDDDSFHTACYHKSLEPFMEAGRRLRADGLSGMEYQEARWKAVEECSLPMPEGPTMVYNFYHDDPGFDPRTGDPATGARLHGIYIRGLTVDATGLPPAAMGSAPWIMWSGKPSSHIMIFIPATVEGDGLND